MKISALKFVQHFVDGIGSKVMNGRNCRLVSMMRIPNSVVPAFAAARFDRDFVFEEFAAKFNIAMTEIKFHDEIDCINFVRPGTLRQEVGLEEVMSNDRETARRCSCGKTRKKQSTLFLAHGWLTIAAAVAVFLNKLFLGPA